MRSPTCPPAAADPASRRSVFAVVLGNAVEFFDFGVYATFAVMIGRTFFPSDSAFVSLLLSVTAFGVGFVIRPSARSLSAPTPTAPGASRRCSLPCS